jgi:hypothetical protein
VKSAHYLELTLGKTKKEKCFIKISEEKHEKIDKISEGLLKVTISDMVTLHCDLPLNKNK